MRPFYSARQVSLCQRNAGPAQVGTLQMVRVSFHHQQGAVPGEGGARPGPKAALVC